MGAAPHNKYALGNKGGRPPIYNSPEELAIEIHNYFEQDSKATITGLALFLGFESRSSLDDYSKRSDEFSFIIKRAKLAVENSYEQSGQAFDIFALKNMGWRDKVETGFTDNEGNDRSVIILPSNGRDMESISTPPLEHK